MTHFQTL